MSIEISREDQRPRAPSIFRRNFIERTQPYPIPSRETDHNNARHIDEWVQKQLDEDLMKWRLDPAYDGYRVQAIREITKAYSEGMKTLQINDLGLFSLPKSLGYLQRLLGLNLANNNLSSIAPCIGHLDQLQILSMKKNRLKIIPDFIGDLRGLWKVDFSQNQIKILSPEIAKCRRLSLLLLQDNPFLKELPLSLGDIPGLEIDVRNTAIPLAMSNVIKERCKKIKESPALYRDLTDRMDTWITYAKLKEDREYQLGFLSNMENRKQQEVAEWLVRLSLISNFQHQQSNLAHLVCSMLETLSNNSEFEESFFLQLEANLCHCQDRSAMSLNEIYLSWRLFTIDPKTPIQEKLQLLVSIGKTLALRKGVAHLLEDQNIGESVELYLYFETRLKEELGLISVIDTMQHEDICDTDTEEEMEIKEYVRENYLLEALRLPQFDLLVKETGNVDGEKIKTENYFSKKQEIEETFVDLHLELMAKNMPEGEMLLKTKEMVIERQKALDEHAAIWFNDHCK